MVRSWRGTVGLLAMIACLVGCTDWGQGEGGGPSLGAVVEVAAGGSSGPAVDAGPTVVALDAWNPTDAAQSADSANTGRSADGSAGADGAIPIDIAIVPADVGSGGSGTSDGGSGPIDVAVGDAAVLDTTNAADAAGAGDADGASTTQDGVSADASSVDSGGSVDSGVMDGGLTDSGGAMDGGLTDSGGAIDGGLADSGGGGDSGSVDGGGGGDSGSVDSGGGGDSGSVDSGGIVDAGTVDSTTSDAPLSDVPLLDVASDAANGGDSTGPTLPDAGWSPGWSGYPDANWPSDVDVYGGVISSCFNAYAYVFQEACTGAALSTTCVDQAALDASLYTQFLFQPLRECADALCVPGCVNKGGDSFACIEKCLGKNCSFPLFACLAQGETGGNDCPATFQCMDSYQDKIFSIANKCFANATAPAQKQLAEFFACGQKPQTDSCFDQLNQCYGSGSTNCLGVIQCSEACAEGDDVCGFQCFGKGSPSAQAQLDQLWDCILAECSDCAGPNGCGDACHSKMCSKQQTACVLGN